MGGSDFFIYQGKTYGVGTKVTFNDNTHINYYNRPSSRTPVFEFTTGYNDGRKRFIHNNSNGTRCASVDIKTTSQSPMLDVYIIDIINPVYVELVSPWQQATDNLINKKVHPDVFSGCLLYALIMLIGAIFIDKWLIWIGGTLIFIIWLLKQYKVS